MAKSNYLFSLPVLKCFTEVKDIDAFKPICLWAEELLNHFNQKIGPLVGTCEVDNEDLELFGNQYTLLLMLTGKNELCIKSVQQIIHYYKNRYEKTENVIYLDKMVQPTINLARFYRLNGKNNQYRSIIRCLNSRNGTITLGGISIKPENLSPKYRILADNVFTLENIKYTLSKKNFTEILSIDNSEPFPTFIFEAYIIALLATGSYQKAEIMIGSQIEKEQGFSRLVLYYRLYELMELAAKEKESKNIYKIFKQLIMQSSQAPLAYLTLFSHYLLHDPDYETADHLIKLYEDLGEELNLGLLLVPLHVHTKIDVKNRLMDLGQKTHYQLLQKKINTVLKKENVHSVNNGQVLMPFLSCFTSVFG